ncbi:LPXTG-motif cell wall anchor domain-containing protein [Amycolatopsis xylanica]|uniref:LPXTG-motif cell wall anchor domain-containing protein n=1 Tax=Amycolatopsis xylanica TaxID=589385 RepID=A0A1H3H7X9_9PSEU|nr:LPXTG cell wall anchor domain-containing protein [Amycolatopsis xylanica]SDY11606.1 LPXTG-motif cell wall anchor domain-containing protein [Amycolatopsis xylanica]
MTRFATKLATVTACSLLVAAPIASAQETEKATGPVSYANIAGIQTDTSAVPPAESDAIAYAGEVALSPTEAGTNNLGTDRQTLPQESLDVGNDENHVFKTKEEMDKKLGTNYQLNLGTFDSAANSPFPADIASTKYSGTTELKDTQVPLASTEGNFALSDFAIQGKKTVDNTVLVIQGAKSSVECESKDKQTGSTTADKILIREDGELKSQLMPTDKPLEVKGLSFGASKDVQDADVDSKLTTSDITISKLTKFEDLIKQPKWLGGDINAAAGWEVKIVTHFVKTDQTKIRDFTTRYVLGGVSCSLPSDFEPEVVPTAVPAGYAAPAAPGDSGTSPLGFTLLGAGALLAGGAALVVRRRRHDH